VFTAKSLAKKLKNVGYIKLFDIRCLCERVVLEDGSVHPGQVYINAWVRVLVYSPELASVCYITTDRIMIAPCRSDMKGLITDIQSVLVSMN